MHDLSTVESFRSLLRMKYVSWYLVSFDGSVCVRPTTLKFRTLFRSGLLSTAMGGLLCTLLWPQFPRTELRVPNFNARKAEALCTICCTLVFSWLIGYGLLNSEKSIGIYYKLLLFKPTKDVPTSKIYSTNSDP